MPVTPEEKSDRKILSEFEIKAACSEFTRLFLIQEAKMLKRHLNSHINQVLRLYFQGKVSKKIKQLKLPNRFVKSILSQQKTYMTLYPYKSVLKLIPSGDMAEMTQEIETAMNCYVIATLSDQEGHKEAKEIGRQILRHLAEWEMNKENDTA